MDAERERVELKDEVLPPRKNTFQSFSAKPVDTNPAVSVDSVDAAADKGLKLFGGEMD